MNKIINKNIIDKKLSDKEIFDNYNIERISNKIVIFLSELEEASLEDLEKNNVKNKR